MDGQVRTERHGPDGVVAELVLDRPAARNALSTAFAGRLRDAALALVAPAEAGEVRAVVLSSSEPSAFCVGADLKERNTFTDADLRAQRVVYRAMQAALRAVPVPVVAAVSGYALGGGYELALNGDVIVVDDTAVLGLPEVSVGVIPGLGGTQLLARRVGPARAGDLIYTARRIGADEAIALGAADHRAHDRTARELAVELALRIAEHSPVAVRNAKRALRAGADVPLAAGLDIEDGAWRATAFSADRAEGVAAFVEKRRPVWPGTA